MLIPLLGKAYGAKRSVGDKCFSDFQEVGGDWMGHPGILTASQCSSRPTAGSRSLMGSILVRPHPMASFVQSIRRGATPAARSVERSSVVARGQVASS